MPKVSSLPITSLDSPHPHPHLIVNDLEQFVWLRNPPRVHLTPYRHVIHGDLECPGGDELRFHGIAEEESHHASVQLVVHHPAPPPRSHGSELLEWIPRHEHSKDHHHLDQADCLGDLQPVSQGSKVVPRDG